MSQWGDERPDMKVGDKVTEIQDGHTFEIVATPETGIHTDRRRYRVTCVSCTKLVHPGSTSASAQIRMHLNNPNYGYPEWDE